MREAVKTARQVCLGLLITTEKNKSYSNIALDNALSANSELSEVDRRFVSALYYGVIERRITLDSVIEKYSARPSDKLSMPVKQILRMGIYQLLYMDSVPDSAAVNESVKLTKVKNPSAAGFVNALLRNFLRDGMKLPLSGNIVKDLSLIYSCPEWLVDMWIRDYGEKTAVSLMEHSLGRAAVTVRLNTCKFSRDDILSELSENGIEVKISDFDLLSDCCELMNCGTVERLSAHKRGMLHVQDSSCQLCSAELEAYPDCTVLDVCSAPGGKAFTIAELMGDKGRVLAYDLHKNRVNLISDGAKRLGLECITASVNDAKIYSDSIPQADRVLCDVPCSGLGVIGKKPEIKYNYSDVGELKRFPEIQYDILNTSSRYVKSGGLLVYSTCTINRSENDEVSERFLREHEDFEGAKLTFTDGYKTTVTPDTLSFGGDGFFIAKFRRRG